MRISDWSSDVCSSDLRNPVRVRSSTARRDGNRKSLAYLPADAGGGPGVEAADVRSGREDNDGLARDERSNHPHTDRKSGVEGKRVAVRVEHGGRRILTKKNTRE